MLFNVHAAYKHVLVNIVLRATSTVFFPTCLLFHQPNFCLVPSLLAVVAYHSENYSALGESFMQSLL